MQNKRFFTSLDMGRRCEKNDLSNFVRIFSNIYTASQLFG